MPLLLFAVLFAIATRRAYCAAKRKGEAAHRVLRETDTERLSRRERKALEAERKAAEQERAREYEARKRQFREEILGPHASDSEATHT